MTPLPGFQPGCSELVIPYRFMDLGSCAGGLNRRESAIIFTLEWQGQGWKSVLLGVSISDTKFCKIQFKYIASHHH